MWVVYEYKKEETCNIWKKEWKTKRNKIKLIIFRKMSEKGLTN